MKFENAVFETCKWYVTLLGTINWTTNLFEWKNAEFETRRWLCHRTSPFHGPSLDDQKGVTGMSNTEMTVRSNMEVTGMSNMEKKVF
jgi:hypothetical protein